MHSDHACTLVPGLPGDRRVLWRHGPWCRMACKCGVFAAPRSLVSESGEGPFPLQFQGSQTIRMHPGKDEAMWPVLDLETDSSGLENPYFKFSVLLHCNGFPLGDSGTSVRAKTEAPVFIEKIFFPLAFIDGAQAWGLLSGSSGS